MYRKTLSRFVVLLCLIALPTHSATIHPPLIDGNKISAASLNARFNEIKNKLLEKSISVSFASFNPNEAISAAKINYNLAMVRDSGIEMSDVVSGAGGAGGDWGQPGNASAISTSSGNATWGIAPGTPGGAAGFSIKSNGHSVTWVSGNNSTQVKGPQQ